MRGPQATLVGLLHNRGPTRGASQVLQLLTEVRCTLSRGRFGDLFIRQVRGVLFGWRRVREELYGLGSGHLHYWEASPRCISLLRGESLVGSIAVMGCKTRSKKRMG